MFLYSKPRFNIHESLFGKKQLCLLVYTITVWHQEVLSWVIHRKTSDLPRCRTTTEFAFFYGLHDFQTAAIPGSALVASVCGMLAVSIHFCFHCTQRWHQQYPCLWKCTRNAKQLLIFCTASPCQWVSHHCLLGKWFFLDGNMFWFCTGMPCGTFLWKTIPKESQAPQDLLKSWRGYSGASTSPGSATSDGFWVLWAVPLQLLAGSLWSWRSRGWLQPAAFSEGILLKAWENITVMNSWLTFSSVKLFVEPWKCHNAFSFQGNVWATL